MAATWNLLFYVKADQPRMEYNYCARQVLLPLFAARGALGDVNVRVQCKRRRAIHQERRQSRELGLHWAYEGREFFSGTRRFDLSLYETPEEVSESERACHHVFDFASPKAIAEYVEWALEGKDAAAHTCLVLWGHGGGWISPFLWQEFHLDKFSLEELERLEYVAPLVAQDDDTRRLPPMARSNSFLTLPELSQGLRAGLDAAGRAQLDIVVFDSCLMACIEAAYELRKLATFMVGSQDLNPFLRWSHKQWLERLGGEPDLAPEALLPVLLEAYGAERDRGTTISAVDLRRIDPLFTEISRFVSDSRDFGAETWAAVARARDATGQYGFLRSDADVLAVDIVRLFGQLAEFSGNDAISRLAGRIVAAAQDAVGGRSRVAPDRQSGKLASNGLSIFFPETLSEFNRLAFGARYRPGGKDTAAFVTDSGWFAFLESYWRETRRT